MKFKKGDRCRITNCASAPSNVGVEVELDEWLQHRLCWYCWGPVVPSESCAPAKGEVPYRRTLIPESMLELSQLALEPVLLLLEEA